MTVAFLFPPPSTRMVVVLVRRIVMFSKTAIALIAASLALGFAAPAMANYAPCVENPAAKGCPGEINQNTNANSYKGAEHPTVPATRHHHG